MTPPENHFPPSGAHSAPISLLHRVRSHNVFEPLRGHGLKALALKGSLWTLVGFGGQKILQLCSNLILTRLLFPEAFGLMALVNVVITGLTMFSDIGIRPSIVQNMRGEDTGFLHTAWTVQVIRGFALWAVACVAAWPASLIYHQPILLPLLCTVGSTAAINGFQSFALATANRKLQLGRLTVVQIAGQAISIAATVLLAWIYDSVWALAFGAVAGSIVQTALGHLAWPAQAHAFRLERHAIDSLLHYGKWIFLATLVTFLGGQGLQAIQGVLVAPATLAMIYIAGTISWTLGDLTHKLVDSVAFPVLSKVAREEPKRLRSVLNGFRFRVLALTLPGFIALSLLSTFIINTLFDRRYAAAGPYLAISAITSALGVLPIYYQNALLAGGDSRAHFIIMVAMMAFRIGGLTMGFHFGGVEGMLVGIALGTLLTYFVSAGFARVRGWLSLRTDLVSIGFILLGAYFSYICRF